MPELRKHYGIPVYVGEADQEMAWECWIKTFLPVFSERHLPCRRISF
ncbi:MAG: hypothetical protein ACLR6B_20355 [Blautia sp.]